MKNKICFAFIALAMGQLGLLGFAQERRNLTREDYGLWHTLQYGGTSYGGSWTYFSYVYENQPGTLYLKQTDTGKEYAFSAAYGGKITPDGRRFAYQRADTLFVLDPTTGQEESIGGVSRYDFTPDGRYLVYLTNASGGSVLNIRDIATDRVMSLERVSEYCFDPTGSRMIVVYNGRGQDDSIAVVPLGKTFPSSLSTVGTGKRGVEQFTWNASGTAFAFYANGDEAGEYTIGFIADCSNPEDVRYLDLAGVNRLHGTTTLAKTSLHVSEQADKVFFDVLPDTKEGVAPVSPIIWKSSDSSIPPKTERSYFRWHVWFPQLDEVTLIEDDSSIACALLDRQNKAVLLDNNRYLPLYEYGYRYSDVYLRDLKTGAKELILEKQLRANGHLVAAPDGRHIAYFKDNHWWCYEVETGRHACVTDRLDVVFNQSESDRLATHQAYSFGGWSVEGELLVYDKFDIWLISPDGKQSQRITKGAESGIRHRIVTYSGRSLRDSFFGFQALAYALDDGLMIRTLDTEKLNEGFGRWQQENGLKEIVRKDAKMYYTFKPIGANRYQYIETRFDTSPRLVQVDERGHEKVLTQANAQQAEYHWGKSELIHYNGPNGEKLKGALFYPAGYDPEKKYPMIVSIYELKSQELHEYTHPSLKTFGGVNVTNFTLEGYFVLLPDIAYTLNETGKSAVKCVLAAVDEAISTASIDAERVGLTGHSFGGFETAYIISQTNRFKTAIAGAGVHDLLGFYLDFDSSNLSNMERFENEQFRNQIPFTDPDFFSESPIHNVSSIETPVLVWTGADDKMVPPAHSTRLFAALWRLQKESTLLVYPNEQHSLVNPANQEDITRKFMDWFDHYLKGTPKAEWMGN